MFGAGYYLGRRSHGGDHHAYNHYGLGGRHHFAYPWYGGYAGFGTHGYGIGLGYGYGSSYGYGCLYPSYGYSTYYYLPRGSSAYDGYGTVIVDGDYVDVDINGAAPVFAAPGDSSSGYAVPVDQAPTDLPPIEQPATDRVPDSEMPASVARGIGAFSAGLYGDARVWFLRAILADAADPNAKLLLGLAHFANGDYDASAIAVRRALMTSPRLLGDPIDLRIFYRDPATFDEQLKRLVAYALARSGAATDEHRGDVRWLLSYLYFATGSPDESLAVLDRIASAGSDDALVSALRDAVVRVLSSRARAIAPSRPSE